MRFVICGAGEGLEPVANRAALIAHWTNVAREMVDAPPNVMSPTELSDRVVRFAHLGSEIICPGGEVALGALAAVGGSRDALGPGASGYGVRMLVELATRPSVTLRR